MAEVTSATFDLMPLLPISYSHSARQQSWSDGSLPSEGHTADPPSKRHRLDAGSDLYKSRVTIKGPLVSTTQSVYEVVVACRCSTCPDVEKTKSVDNCRLSIECKAEPAPEQLSCLRIEKKSYDSSPTAISVAVAVGHCSCAVILQRD